MDERVKETLFGFEKRGYEAVYCEGSENLCETIEKKLFAEDDLSSATIGFGHSETLERIGLYPHIRKRAARVYRHDPPGTSAEEDRMALQSDVYFLSANAVTRDGTIVNIDGTGNRIAASCFGPRRVAFVIGKNKITDTLDEAIDRAVNHVSVLLSRAHPMGKSLPCVREGKCVECFSPGCPCGVMAIHRKNLFGSKTTVFLVDAELGI